MSKAYHPEPYWNEVARKIGRRTEHQLIAGDNEPYYRYQREKFLRLFHQIDFKGQRVLELGPGPGGNLLEVWKHAPGELWGADISDQMIALAENRVRGRDIRIKKIDGEHLPFSDGYFNLSYTATVLQHNTDEQMLKQVVGELCRVTAGDIYTFEKIDSQISGTPLCLGRPISYYEQIFLSHGFALSETHFLNLPASFLVCGGLRKLFNKRNRKEGEPASGLTVFFQNAALPFTSLLDRIIRSRRGVAMLHFERQ